MVINLTEIRKFPLLLLFFVFSFCVPPPCFFFRKSTRSTYPTTLESSDPVESSYRASREREEGRVVKDREGEKEGGEAEPRARHRGEGID